MALITVVPFFAILSHDLFAAAQGDRLRSRRGQAVRVSLAIFWVATLIATFVATIWLTLGARLTGVAGFLILAVPPFTAVYALRFMGPGLTRFVMRLSRA
jgi:RsiW-degrading membrane proteinase PrsW (M82 family)